MIQEQHIDDRYAYVFLSFLCCSGLYALTPLNKGIDSSSAYTRCSRPPRSRRRSCYALAFNAALQVNGRSTCSLTTLRVNSNIGQRFLKGYSNSISVRLFQIAVQCIVHYVTSCFCLIFFDKMST